MQVSVSRQLPEEVPVAHKEVDLAPCQVVGLVLQVQSRRCKGVSSGTWFRKPGSYLFFRISKQCPCFTVIEEDGGDKRHVLLELGCEAASSGII